MLYYLLTYAIQNKLYTIPVAIPVLTCITECKFNLRKKNVPNFIFCSLVRENYTKFFLIIIVKKGKEQNLHITTPTTTTKSAVEENAQKHKSTNQS